MDDYFLQNYKIRITYIISMKSILYKNIFAKIVDNNFLQIIFHNKICNYFIRNFLK